jgi:hypothetical protein
VVTDIQTSVVTQGSSEGQREDLIHEIVPYLAHSISKGRSATDKFGFKGTLLGSNPRGS